MPNIPENMPYSITPYSVPANLWWLSGKQIMHRKDLVYKCLEWCKQYPSTDWFLDKGYNRFYFTNLEMYTAFKLKFETVYARSNI